MKILRLIPLILFCVPPSIELLGPTTPSSQTGLMLMVETGSAQSQFPSLSQSLFPLLSQSLRMWDCEWQNERAGEAEWERERESRRGSMREKEKVKATELHEEIESCILFSGAYNSLQGERWWWLGCGHHPQQTQPLHTAWHSLPLSTGKYWLETNVQVSIPLLFPL